MYSKQGIEYGDLDTLPITSLPIIDKKAIRKNFYSIPTCKLSEHDINKTLKGESLIPHIGDKYLVHTSGSTGAPTNFIYDKRALMILEANFVRLTIQGGEPLTKEASQYFHDVFGADVIDYYGCTESIFIGAGSSYYDGIYFYDDLNYTEVDDSNRLIITPLYNRTFPLIRYKLTDIMDGFTKNEHGGLPYTHINKVL